MELDTQGVRHGCRGSLTLAYGPRDDGVMAFTDFGIETLTRLIEIYKADPDLLKRSSDPG